jgi:predicted RNA-binding protein with PUA-like domain
MKEVTMNHWLVKSEPDVFSVDDLAACPDQTRWWKHVRNYQARNFMRDDMRVGDKVFFYHSNTEVPGIVGVAEVAREAYPDPDAFDPRAKYFDAKSDPENPRWFLVDIRLLGKLDDVIALKTIKAHAEALGDLPLLRRGNRLSVMPLSGEQWDYIMSLQAAA